MMLDLNKNIELENYWNSKSSAEKLKLLLKYDFWDGFHSYKYEYLPIKFKEKLYDEIKSNH
jgi:hypothetical protein